MITDTLRSMEGTFCNVREQPEGLSGHFLEQPFS